MIYVIGKDENGPLKVGISKDPQRRLRQLQTASGIELQILALGRAGLGYTDRQIEKSIHSQLQDVRMVGEWFDTTLVRVFFETLKYYGLDAAPPSTHVIWRKEDDLSPAMEAATDLATPLIKENFRVQEKLWFQKH